MVDVDLQTASIVVASASVVAGIIYYSLQIRHQTKVSQTDLIIRLYSLVASKEFLDAWETVRNRKIESISQYKEKYGNFTEVSQVNTVLGELGMLLRRKLITVDLVYDLTGGMPMIAWEKLKPINEDVKKNRGLESDSFDYLYNEMKKKEEPQPNKHGT
jgi:hypothetical protein